MSYHKPRHENHLKDERSPYLKQHAGNPVEWYPWSEEALKRARQEDKPLIVSIGYSSCHWCHVMERESFEDEEVARLMNENFINIKVDREERPDIDSLYLKAVQAMTGHAGWPLTVFTNPEGVPFYGGSYFPPDERFGLPSFKKVLLAASLAYRKSREKIDLLKIDIERALSPRAGAVIDLDSQISEGAFEAAKAFYDPVYGGFGRGTKFPHTMFLEFLLKYHKRTGEDEALIIIEKTLTEMAEGGLYDQIGGGFHRYSVDERWDVPHFEKMLYDNAQLASLYLNAYGLTGEDFYREVAVDTIGCMMREMKDPGGAFYSSIDADVSGEEGTYYTWDYGEVERVLGKDAARVFCDYYSIPEAAEAGSKNPPRVNRLSRTSSAEIRGIKEMRKSLLKTRLSRTAPEKDRKIITAWNGLAISTLAGASVVLKDPAYLEGARACAGFLLDSIREKERLLRYYLDGKGGVKGTLEDYALFGGALFDLYSASRESFWLQASRSIAESMIDLFYDRSDGLFYDTGVDQERLFVRERDLYDSDLPSGNSAAAELLLRLSRELKRDDLREISEGILRSVDGLRDEPLSYGKFLTVLEAMLGEEGRGLH